MGGPCQNSSWINFCQLWLKCVVLDVSDTIVLCFILLLASLAPATINPTMVRQELQVTVARVTIVRSDWHHYSSSPLPRAPLPALGAGKAAGSWRKEGESSPGGSQVGFSSCCRRTCDLHHLRLYPFAGHCFFFTFAKRKKNNHQIGKKKKKKRWCM